MNKSIKAKPKKRGRPATGKDPMIGLRIPDELTAKIDKYADQRGISRSAVIREVLDGAFSKGGWRK